MRANDNGFSIVAGRPRHKPWEKKATVVLRLEEETHQRIRRLAKKEELQHQPSRRGAIPNG
jgi:hypothetical protein